MDLSISGNIVDVIEKSIFPGTIFVSNGVIIEIKKEKNLKYSNYILPGFIDSHIHIESSMLPPSEFARNAVRFGTVATISDPHEIANVCGIEGIQFMLEDASKTPLKFFFGAPSCVPATNFETSGARLGVKEVEFLFKELDISYLSEMMNFPGVINEDPEVISKIEIAHKFGVPIDGHCPGLRGDDLRKYISKGILTDHESLTIEESEEKISNGMKILIREGSAAKNFQELIPLLKRYPSMVMFCSDDLHPYDLEKGHMNLLVRRALQMGFDLFDVLRAASLNPIIHYGLPVGLLKVGDDADFIVVNNLENLNILETYIQGRLVAKDGVSLIEKESSKIVNNFNIEPVNVDSIKLQSYGKNRVKIIEAIDNSLVTKSLVDSVKVGDGYVVSDVERDILKIVVVNRYVHSKPSIGFVKGFGLTRGAIATSVAHDSHNIIAIGVDDKSIVNAINLVIENKGGIAFVHENVKVILTLPIGGLMSTLSLEEVSEKYLQIENLLKDAGSKLTSPLMTLSFMSLLVIPRLKIGDKGLFDVEQFSFTELFVE